MNVYTCIPADGYEWVLPVEDAGFEQLAALADGVLGARWRPLLMRLISQNEGRDLAKSDIPWCVSHVLVLRGPNIESQGPLLTAFGQLLPLECPGVSLVMFSPQVVLGALDESASEIWRFSTGRIMDIRTPVLREEVVVGAGMLRLAEDPRGSIYLTEEVVESLTSADSTAGVDFVKLG